MVGSKQSFTKGQLIGSLDELISQEFIYWKHKITHKGWFSSWPIRFAFTEIQMKNVFKANKVEEDKR